MLPGCSFAVGIGSGARDDARTVLTCWLLSTPSVGVLLVAILAWFARRAVLEAAARFYDRRQSQAFRRYRQSFAGCRLERLALASLGLSPPVEAAVRACSAALRLPGVPEIWFVDRVDVGAQRPGAFTTFFFLRMPPIIVCPSDPREATGYQRFILHHELGHAAGFQTSHSSSRLAAVADACLIGSWFLTLGTDVRWAGVALGVYASLRLYELVGPPGSGSAEAHADLWGVWGVEAEGGDVERMLRLHSRFLGHSGVGPADPRLSFVTERRARLMGKAGVGGTRPDIRGSRGAAVEQDVGSTFADVFGRIENEQLGGPGGLSRLRYASMLVTGLPLAAGLGVALPPLEVASPRMVVALALMAVLFVAARLLAANMEAHAGGS